MSEYTTTEELEKFEAAMDKTFVRLGGDGKPLASDKEYFYRVLSCHPQASGVGLVESEYRLQFNVQKYHRGKFSEEVNDAGKKVKKHLPVSQFDENGRLVDTHASFFIDAGKFMKEWRVE